MNRRFEPRVFPERNPPVDAVVRYNVIPTFVKILKQAQEPRLQVSCPAPSLFLFFLEISVFELVYNCSSRTSAQFEAAWCLTNICTYSSAHMRLVIEADAVPNFVALLQSPDEEAREQAAWALGNVAFDSPEVTGYRTVCGL